MSTRIRRTYLVLITIAVVWATLTIIGCGSSDTPSQVVEKYYKATQDNNCEKVSDLVVSGRPKVLENFVNSCKRYSGKLVSYSIKGETFAYDGRVAQVDTDVTLKDDNGMEKTTSVRQTLSETDDGWKLTELEDRG